MREPENPQNGFRVVFGDGDFPELDDLDNPPIHRDGSEVVLKPKGRKKKKQPGPTRREYAVRLYGERDELLDEMVVKARNKFQAFSLAHFKTHPNHDVRRGTVDGADVYPFDEQENGKGFRRHGAINAWYKIPITTRRKVDAHIPNRAKSAFVTDAIEAKFDQEMDQILRGESKYLL